MIPCNLIWQDAPGSPCVFPAPDPESGTSASPLFPFSKKLRFFSGHDWAPKNWWFQTVVLEKTPETPFDSRESKPASPKGNKPWIFIGGNDFEALILWPPDVKGELNGKDPDAGKEWRQEEKGVTEKEIFGCIIEPMDMSLSKLQEIVTERESGVLQLMRSQSWTQLSTEQQH